MELAKDYYRQIAALGSEVGACALESQNPNDLIAIILRMPDVAETINLEPFPILYYERG